LYDRKSKIQPTKSCTARKRTLEKSTDSHGATRRYSRLQVATAWNKIHLNRKRWMELDHRTTQEVEQAGGDGRVVTQAHVHDQHARLDVHDAVLLRAYSSQSQKRARLLYDEAMRDVHVDSSQPITAHLHTGKRELEIVLRKAWNWKHGKSLSPERKLWRRAFLRFTAFK